MYQHFKASVPPVVKLMSSVITLFMTLYAIFLLGPWLEMRYWPVLSKLEILRIEPQSPLHADMYVQFTKERDCQYIGMAWFKGLRSGGFERVLVIPMRDPKDTGSPNRPLGTQRAGPWRISMLAEEVKTNSFANIFHQCHPFWITHTKFYP